MNTVFIFHGTAGYPEENWFNVFEEYKQYLNSDTILVGHSLGGTFLLRLLEKSDIKIKASFLVAAPIGIQPIKNYLTDKPFLDQPFNWNKIKEHCQKFFVFHSDTDPFVTLENGEQLAKNLNTKLFIIPGCGHFNKTAGFDKFELLLEKIKGML